MTVTRQAWSEDAIGSLHGRMAVVTGANSGVGLTTAQLLAEHGVRVVLACRDKGKGSKPPGTQLTPPQATRSGTGRSTSPTWSLRAHWAASAVAARASGRTGGNCQQRHRRPGQDRSRGPPGPTAATSGSPATPGRSWRTSCSRPNSTIAPRTGKLAWLATPAPPPARFSLARSETGAAGRPRLSEVILARIQALAGQPPQRAARTALYAATGAGDRRRVHRTWRTDPPEGAPQEVAIPEAAFDPAVRRRLWDLSARLTGADYAALT